MPLIKCHNTRCNINCTSNNCCIVSTSFKTRIDILPYMAIIRITEQNTLLKMYTLTQAPSTRIRIFFNPQLFLSGYENIRVHKVCDHSVFTSNSPVHTYSDSLRIHFTLLGAWGFLLVRSDRIERRSLEGKLRSGEKKNFSGLSASSTTRSVAAGEREDLWHPG